MKQAISVALGAGILALASAASVAGTDAGSWYVAPTIQGVIVDDDRAADDGLGVSLAVVVAILAITMVLSVKTAPRVGSRAREGRP